MLEASPEKLIQVHKGGGDLLAVWLANSLVSLFSHLAEVKCSLEIVAWGVTIAFTIWRWRKAAKGKGDQE